MLVTGIIVPFAKDDFREWYPAIPFTPSTLSVTVPIFLLLVMLFAFFLLPQLSRSELVLAPFGYVV